MSEFGFRTKLESWVEGIFDTFEVYFLTLYLFVTKPKKISTYLKEDNKDDEISITSPGFFLVLSYFFTLYMIKDFDFTTHSGIYDWSRLLNAIGSLDAVRSFKTESIILNFIPAIFLLMWFVSLSSLVLYIFKEPIDTKYLRTRYSYFFGFVFLSLGTYAYLCDPFLMPLLNFIDQFGLHWLALLGDAIFSLIISFPMVFGTIFIIIDILPKPTVSKTNLVNLLAFFISTILLKIPWWIFIE